MSFSVGQVLYVFMNKNRAVIPVQVVEEVTRKTLDEIAVSYVVCLPDSDKTHINLDDIESKPFNSIEDVRDHMMKNAKDAISSIIEKSKKTSISFFGKSATLDSKSVNTVNNIDKDNTVDDPDILSNSETLDVDLGDGIKARIDLSSLESS